MKLVATLLLVLVAGVATAGEAAVRVTGIYSNLRYGEESGDLTGWEILVTPRESGGYNATIQLAEGGAPMIMVGTLVVSGAKVALTIPPGQLLAGTVLPDRDERKHHKEILYRPAFHRGRYDDRAVERQHRHYPRVDLCGLPAQQWHRTAVPGLRR